MGAASGSLVAIALVALFAHLSSDRSVPVTVLNCYSTTSDFKVSIDGRSLQLLPPAERNDSVAVCHDGTVNVGATAAVVIERGRETRRLFLPITRDVRVIAIDAHALTAKTARELPMLD